jgi:iron complex transport system substrate-binding protein
VGEQAKVEQGTWRRWAAVLLIGALAATGAACGGDDADAEDTSGADTATEASGDATFPVTIEHKYGETTIEEQPERVVSVGFTDQDVVLALGVKPVGIRDWYGDQPDAVWPWAQDELGDAEPEVLSSAEINFEQVASLQPDLIVGVSSGMTEEEYETLAQIAPTLTQSDEYVDYGVPWQAATRLIGTALGRSDQAEALIEDLEADFAAARAAHPEFEGATGVIAYVMDEDEVGGYGPQDTRSRILTDLGFVLPQTILDLTEDSFYATFSAENVDRLDADAVAWLASTDAEVTAIKASPLRSTLKAANEGREVFVGAELGAAAGFSSPLSLELVLDELVPLLALAVDGDPATVVP